MAYERNNGVHIDDFINMVGVPIGSIVSKKVVFLDDKALIVSEPYKDKGYHFSDSEKDDSIDYTILIRNTNGQFVEPFSGLEVDIMKDTNARDISDPLFYHELIDAKNCVLSVPIYDVIEVNGDVRKSFLKCRGHEQELKEHFLSEQDSGMQYMNDVIMRVVDYTHEVADFDNYLNDLKIKNHISSFSDNLGNNFYSALDDNYHKTK